MKVVGPGEEAWRAFVLEASPEELRQAFVALLELTPGSRGRRAREAYRLEGWQAAKKILNEPDPAA